MKSRRVAALSSVAAACCGLAVVTVLPGQNSEEADLNEPQPRESVIEERAAPPSPVGDLTEPGERAVVSETVISDSVLDAGEAFAFGNRAYEDGDFARAAELYQQLLDGGHESGTVYYNFGNALLRSGELGPAIASYLRAQRRRPRDRDIAANLEFARGSVLDDLPPPRASAVARTLFPWHFGLSTWELWRATILVNALVFAVLAVRLLRSGSEWLRWLATGLALIGAVLLISATLRTIWPQRSAVVIAPEAHGHNSTAEDSPVRFLLHSGAEVDAVETRPGWVRVRLPQGDEGWMPDDQVAVVAR